MRPDGYRTDAWHAFDRATQLRLEELCRKPVDCFGDAIRRPKPADQDQVVRTLAQRPMRLRQLCVRLEAKRENVREAVAILQRCGRVMRDEEAFYWLAAAP